MPSIHTAFSRLAALASFFVLASASCHGGPPAASPPGGSGTTPTLGATPRLAFAVAEPPLALTAADGTTLRLASLRAEAVIDGPLAFTEVHLEFQNPVDRRLEGTFRITLPQRASLGRFAMKIDSEWQEGEVVELEAARRAYEDFLHRKQDPALLEKSAGNEFSARVFPIPASGTKEIVVSWVEELAAGYTFALRGLPELDRLEVSARRAGPAAGALPRLALDHAAPKTDYVVDAPALGESASVRSGELALVRVRPQPASSPEPLADAIVLVDTSASRVLGFDEEIEVVRRLAGDVARAGANARLTVACFDQSVAPIFDGRAADFGAEAAAKIRDRGALGASDLERALVWAGDAAKKSGRSGRRVILVTDGVATAGTTDAKKLTDRVTSLRGVGVDRIDAVALGGIRDAAGLARLVRGTLPHDGVVADGSDAPASVARHLGQATVSGITVKVDGATWSWPTKLDGVQAGDSYSVYAEVPAGKPLRVAVGGKSSEAVEARTTERPLLERAVAQAKVGSMLERDAQLDAASPLHAELKRSITQVATRSRIMTPFTAMLVLETDADYARFGIDRRSLVDVLALDKGAVRRLHRSSVKLPLAPPDEPVSNEMLNATAGDPSVDLSVAEEKPTAAPRGPRPARAAAPAPMRVEHADRKESKKTEAASPMPAATASAPPRLFARPPPPPPARAVRPAPQPRVAAKANDDDESTAFAPPPASALGPMQMADSAQRVVEPETQPGQAPYEGPFAEVMDQLRAGKREQALARARGWHAEAPGDVLALTALGEAAEAGGQTDLAARAYGSVLDLFPNRADLRRFAGERLERLAAKDPATLDLAIDTFVKALADRPDHPSSHRLLTFALLKKKLYARAFDAAIAGVRQPYEVDRFAGVDRILREDLGLVAAVWAKAEPAHRAEIERRVRAEGGTIEDKPSLRFVLNWETDANDVDFHIHDARGGHAYFGDRHLPSGGDLYADVTTGYGPECFTIRAAKGRRAGPYKLEAHYYSRGPMGYGMGKLQIVDHDGEGNLTFEERPFVVMVDQAFVDLGTVK